MVSKYKIWTRMAATDSVPARRCGAPSVAGCAANTRLMLKCYVHRNRRFIRDGSPGRPVDRSEAV